MVVCRFFQQGNCRFGQSCRFEHVYGSKYTYHANQTPQAVPTQPAGSTDQQLVNQVQADMQSALRGGQWILSCYSPFKEKPVFPGMSDLSPEEARLFIYEAKNSNSLEQAVAYMNNLFKDAKQKYEQLLQPNPNIMKVLRSLYKGEVVASPFSNTEQTSANTTSTSIFRSAVQNTTPTNQNSAASIFGQGQKSIFNTQPEQVQDLFSRANNNIFGQSPPSNVFGVQNQSNSDAKSIFASAAQNTNNQFNTTSPVNPSNIFSSANQSIFGSQPTQNRSPFTQVQSNSPFGQTQTNSPFGQTQNNSPFGQTQSNSPFSQGQSNSPFGQPQNNSPFGQAQSSSPFGQEQNNSPFSQENNSSPFGQSNVFQKTESPASIFGQANKQVTISNDPGVYSQMEDLPDADLEAFKSNNFELGFVPELPTPYQLCTRAL